VLFQRGENLQCFERLLWSIDLYTHTWSSQSKGCSNSTVQRSSIRPRVWTHISQKPQTLPHRGKPHSGTWRAVGFVTRMSLPVSFLLPLVSGPALPGVLSLAKSFSHLPPAWIFSIDLGVGVLLEAVARAGSSRCPSFKVTVKISLCSLGMVVGYVRWRRSRGSAALGSWARKEPSEGFDADNFKAILVLLN